MKKFTKVAKLKEMERMARGNPKKIAEFQMALRRYRELCSEVFNEERKFVDGPIPSYVERLKEEAEAPEADDAAKLRYAIMNDRREYQDYSSKQEHFDNVKTRQELRQKLDEGKATQADVHTAEKYTRKFPSPQNLAMYAQMKRIAETE